MKTDKISKKNWIVILVTGLAGQLCWHVENQWFNTFVYAKIAPDPDIISNMVIYSAITSVFATVFFGTLSDRAGKRKPSMVYGYFIWSITVILFGLTAYLRTRSVGMAATSAVIADCVMTFFGSMAHDAGFNPWSSDISNERNRGMLGAVIAVLPVIASIVGSLLFGNLIDKFDYTVFFIIIGVMMLGASIFTHFCLQDNPDIKPNRDPKGFWHQFISFFNFSQVREDRLLLWVLLIFSTYFIGFQMYFTHITNYLIYSCGYTAGLSGILLGVGLLLASPVTFFVSRYLNQGKFYTLMDITVVVSIIGLLVLQVPGKVAIVGGIFLIGSGYMCLFQTLMVMLKNLYPEETRGQSEGLRTLFYVMIPMCIGTPFGSYIIKTSGVPTVNEYGIEGFAASRNLFLYAAAWTVLTLIPIHFARKEAKKRK